MAAGSKDYGRPNSASGPGAPAAPPLAIRSSRPWPGPRQEVTLAELATFGRRPFWAFTIGVLVNVPLGYVLSTIVFPDYWARI